MIGSSASGLPKPTPGFSGSYFGSPLAFGSVASMQWALAAIGQSPKQRKASSVFPALARLALASLSARLRQMQTGIEACCSRPLFLLKSASHVQ